MLSSTESSKRLSARLTTISVWVLGVLLLALTTCVTFSTKIVSPTGRYSATITEVDGGATEPFHSSVEVKPRWGLRGHLIFLGDFAAKELQVTWRDDLHLRIRFPQETYPWSTPVNCERSWGEVQVECEVVYPLAHPDAPPVQ